MTTAALPTLEQLKLRLGITGNAADAQLAHELAVATNWVTAHVYPSTTSSGAGDEYELEVGEAMLVAASRWYARRNTPEGVAGWTELGLVHVLASDPDLESLLERQHNMHEVGFA